MFLQEQAGLGEQEESLLVLRSTDSHMPLYKLNQAPASESLTCNDENHSSNQSHFFLRCRPVLYAIRALHPKDSHHHGEETQQDGGHHQTSCGLNHRCRQTHKPGLLMMPLLSHTNASVKQRGRSRQKCSCESESASAIQERNMV